MSYRIISESDGTFKIYYIQSNRIFKKIPWFWHYVKERSRYNKLFKLSFFHISDATTWIEEHIKPKNKSIIKIEKIFKL